MFASTIKTSYCYACKFSLASRKITETKVEVNTHAQFFPRKEKKKTSRRPRSFWSEPKSLLLFFVSEVGRWIESSTSLLKGRHKFMMSILLEFNRKNMSSWNFHHVKFLERSDIDIID